MCYCAQSLSCVQLFTTPWAAAYQAPLSMDFSKQENEWVASASPGDLPNSGIELVSLASPALAGRFFTTITTCKH